MKIQYKIEKNDDDFIIELIFKTHVSEISFDFSIITEAMKKEFITFSSTVQNSYLSNKKNECLSFKLSNDSDQLSIVYENEIIIIKYNYTRFIFKNIANILAVFATIAEEMTMKKKET